jgi:ribosomal-protein-alanine N-acetyltransferase
MNIAGNFNIEKVIIRSMAVADINRVAEMEREIFSDPWPRRVFQQFLVDPEAFLLVAEWSGIIIGYAMHSIAYGEAQLANIAVDEKFRGKSIAKKLLNCILDGVEKAGCDYIFLDVRRSNNSAIGFYRAFGFTELYYRREYYTSPVEDALVMVKNIREEQG